MFTSPIFFETKIYAKAKKPKAKKPMEEKPTEKPQEIDIENE